MAKQSLYIRLPVPGKRGDECAYVKIDETRLRPDVLTQLFVKLLGREGNPYQPTTHAPSFLAHTDIAPLTERTREVVGVYDGIFEHGTPSGKLVHAKVLSHLDQLTTVFQKVADGQMESAANDLEGILHALLSGASEVADLLETRAAHVDGMTASFDQASTTLQTDARVTQRLYEDVCSAVRKLLRATETLSSIDKTLATKRLEVDTARSTWQHQLSREASCVKDALAFLIGTEKEAGFNMKLHAYTRNPADVGDIEEELHFAASLLDDCFRAREKARAEREALRALLQEIVAPARSQIDDLCTELAEASAAIRAFLRDYEGATPPYLFPGTAAKITEGQWEAALDLYRDRDWAPRQTRMRLDAKAAGLLRVLEEPDFPNDVRIELTAEQDRLARAQEAREIYLSHQDSPTVEESEDRGVPPPLTEGRTIVESRLLELYELVQCVGLVKTCTTHFASGSNVRAMLDVVRILGRCSDEEAQNYGSRINDLTHEPGGRETVVKTGDVTKRWRNTTAIWVKYEMKKQARLKLASKQRERVEALMQKHNLTVADVTTAYDQRRREQYELWTQRKSEESSSS